MLCKRGEKYYGGRVAEDHYRYSNILQDLLAALTTFPSALSMVLKTIPRSLVVETVGMVWALGGLWVGRV